MASLFTDAAARARVEREQQRLPLSYFQASLPVLEGWADRPGAYLAFGETYRRERDEATRWGWPVSTLPGGRRHLLNDPTHVATEIIALIGQLGIHGARNAT